jgi:hypothetical protein
MSNFLARIKKIKKKFEKFSPSKEVKNGGTNHVLLQTRRKIKLPRGYCLSYLLVFVGFTCFHRIFCFYRIRLFLSDLLVFIGSTCFRRIGVFSSDLLVFIGST